MPAVFTPAQINPLLDSCGTISSALMATYGQRDNSVPLVGWAAVGQALTLKNAENAFLLNFTDLEASNLIGPALFQLRGQLDHVAVLANIFSDLFSRLGQATQAMGVAPGVISLDQWLAHYNYGAGGTNTALQGPHVRYIMECLGMSPSPGNFCYPASSSGLHVGAQTGAVFSAGTRTVDTSKFSGGFPKLKFITYASPNGAVTVTGECWDPATQTIVTGRTWVTTGGTFTAGLEERDLIPGGGSPAPANALLTRATAMSGVNSGNEFYVRLYPPTGRSMATWFV